jgi:hypothetical protein
MLVLGGPPILEGCLLNPPGPGIQQLFQVVSVLEYSTESRFTSCSKQSIMFHFNQKLYCGTVYNYWYAVALLKMTFFIPKRDSHDFLKSLKRTVGKTIFFYSIFMAVNKHLKTGEYTIGAQKKTGPTGLNCFLKNFF